MNLGPHAAFIVTAYGAAGAIVAALILWVAIDRIRLRRTIEELEGKGITRRSERAGEVKQ
jgi:heme exporter protein D